MEANREVVAQAAGFVAKVNDIILFPLIYLLMAVAFLIFLVGCAQYVFKANEPAERAKGTKNITWGLFGLLVMVSAWSILSIVAGTFGLDDEVDCARTPSGTGCEDAFDINVDSIKFE